MDDNQVSTGIDAAAGGYLSLNLDLIYTHRGLPYDFPLRLLISSSNHTCIRSKVTDLMIYRTPGGSKVDESSLSDSLVNYCEQLFSTPTTATTTSTGDGDQGEVTFRIKVHVGLEYTTKYLPLDAALVFQTGLSIKNQYGRRGTREGGMCYVSILELLGNVGLCKGGVQKGGVYYSLRPLCCSAANYTGSRWIGSLAVALADEPAIPATKSNRYAHTYDNVGCRVHLNTKSEDSIIPMVQRVFGAKLRYPFEVPGGQAPRDASILGKVKNQAMIRKSLKTRKSSVQKEEWCINWEKIKNQDRLVYVDLDKTSHMKCPLAPMDACIWQNYEPYGLDYCFQEGEEGVHQSLLVSGEYVRDFMQNPDTAAKIYSLNQGYIRSYVGESTSNKASMTYDTVNSKFKPLVGDRRTTSPNMETESYNWFSKFKSPGEGDRLYLPFYAFLKVPRLETYKGYWLNTLQIMIQREEFKDLTHFTTFFFHPSTSPYVKATYAMKLICLYPQCIEYYTDYSVSQKWGGGREKVVKKEVEQFWNSLVSMVADCEDSALGIYQCYRAFVLTPDRKTLFEQGTNGVLFEMRRVLLHNYVIFLNIEGVRLYKQTNSTNRGGGNKHKHRKDKESVNEAFYRHTLGLDSAHAAIKLIPKLYFERCVNRSMDCLGKTPVFSKNHQTEHCTCDYHSYPPDDYNDDLDILLGEGTSKLSTGFDKTLCRYPWFEKMMASNGLINDVTKTTLYPKKSGSTFYKASFFGITPHFLKDHGVSTFKYCRPMDSVARVNDYVRRNYRLLKGVSYTQLCNKDEGIAMLPAGEYWSDFDSVREESGKANGCTQISFKERESTREMEDLVNQECLYRIQPKKVQRPLPISQVLEERVKYIRSNEVQTTSNSMSYSPYNMIIDDTLHKLESNRKKLTDWAMKMNRLFFSNNNYAPNGGGGGDDDPRSPYLSYTANDYAGGHYNLFIDNYYITDSFLNLLHETLANGLREYTPRGHKILTKVYLEEISNDMRVWRIAFYLS